MAQVTAEWGFQRTSVTSVVVCARISRFAFYEVFDNIEDCFLALLRRIMRRSTALITEAFEREGTWQDGVLAGLVALLDFLDSEPLLARVCLVETLAAGPAALAQRAHELAALNPLVNAGRAQAPEGNHPPAMTAEAIVAAVAGVLHTRLVTGVAPPFVELLGPLVGVVTAPYLDPQSVAREIDKAARLAESILRERSSRPLQTSSSGDTQIPATLRAPGAHRARASFLYIAEHPGASNQDVAAGIELRHHGQMSKLLTRLESLGLLAKRAGGAGRPNAWSLTPYGERVAQRLKDAW